MNVIIYISRDQSYPMLVKGAPGQDIIPNCMAVWIVTYWGFHKLTEIFIGILMACFYYIDQAFDFVTAFS